MTLNHLVNQHILEYESRLKKIKELYARAHKATAHLDENDDIMSELAMLEKRKALLEKETEEIKTISVDDWRKETVRTAGPMALWDIVAQQLEDFVERHE